MYFYEPGNWGWWQKKKKKITPSEKLNICKHKLSRKTHWFMFLWIRTSALVFLFSEIKRMLWILALKSSKIEFHLIRVTIGLAVNTHRTLSPDIFFHEMLVCHSCVFTQLWSCQETWFCEQRNWALMVKIIFSTFGNWIIAASNLPEKNGGSFFSSSQQQIWSRFCCCCCC